MKTILSKTRFSWNRQSQATSLLQAKCLFHTDRNNDNNNKESNIISSILNNNNNNTITNNKSNTDVLTYLRSCVTKNTNNINTTNNNNNNNGMLAASSAAALVTTAGGYTLAPLAVTLISNAPLVAFAFVQASGIGPIRSILAEKRTRDLSPFPFVSLYTNCGIWTLYGILNSDQTIILANAAGVIAGLIYTGIFAKNTHISMLPYYLGSFSLLSVMLSSPLWISGGNESAIQLLGTFGCASAVILMASPLSVVNTVLKEKATESMPFAMSLAMTINGTAWGTYGWVVANDIYVYLPNILGAMAGVVQLGLHGKFGIDSKSTISDASSNNNNNNANNVK